MNNILPYIATFIELCLYLLGTNYIINPIINEILRTSYASEYLHIIQSVTIAFSTLLPFTYYLKPNTTDTYALIIAICMIVENYNIMYSALYCILLFILYHFSKRIDEETRFHFSNMIMLFCLRYTIVIYILGKPFIH
jgi:hypothetical protein